ncbi:BZIP-type transcription factor mbz1 [Claviceps pusilla]|uniref:BZIP-type transcription factor mbz1 n=1 Tax=Claviceps pusilla TaxID=123648 RepID=A0A9P7NG15_9HYPO|nr:BZIP-type transcription factor mbz1 [Claviceps pusilla]
MSTSGENQVDFDALLNFPPEDFSNSFNSPSLSPAPSLKPTFAAPVTAAITTPTIHTSQTLSGPSHNYGMYPQQTGFVPGAIAHTMAVNQTNDTGYQAFGSMDYLSGLSPETDAFNFNTSPSQGAMDVEFESHSVSQPCFSTVNPSNIEQGTSLMSSQSSSVGRLWPGAHSQAALAKAEAQRQQQQQQQQKQQQQQHHRQQSPQYMDQQSERHITQKTRGKGPQPTDPIVEQKITQLLNSMRAKSAGTDSESQSVTNNISRAKKDDEDMDEDERLLASEEGKKLSSKERRQLRNKVSARAFRSRRKEYITQLEAEIASKVNENGDLRSQNRALMEENKRLSDLTHMLLASPSFSDFLDNLSNKSAGLSQNAPIKVEQTPQQEQNEVPKDLNPYNEQFTSQQQIGMAMIPEPSMDFSLVNPDNLAYNFQPQVFVVDTSDIAPIDAAVLSGKTSNFVGEVFSSMDEEKVEVSALERPLEANSSESACDATVDEEFESDPEFVLFHSETVVTSEAPKEINTENLIDVDIFGGIETEKMFTRFELVDATEQEASAAFAMARVQRLSACVESVVSRLELLTMDLS